MAIILALPTRPAYTERIKGRKPIETALLFFSIESFFPFVLSVFRSLNRRHWSMYGVLANERCMSACMVQAWAILSQPRVL